MKSLKLIRLMILLLAVASAFVIWQQVRLSVLTLSHFDPLPEVHEMFEEERYREAADYLGFFMRYDYVSENPEAQTLDEKIYNKRNEWWYQISKLAEGLLSGTSDEKIGQTVGVITDFFIIGDVRDLTKEFIKLSQGEEVDKVLVGLSFLGASATFAQFVSAVGTGASGGASAPALTGATVAKSGLIALKTARKLGKLPTWLSKSVIATAKSGKESTSLSTFADIIVDVNTLAKTRGGFKLLSETKDAKSLEQMATFARTFEDDTATLYRIGGDLAIKSTLHATKEFGKETVFLAATFGKNGLRLLNKVGVFEFTKISSRFLKMAYKGDLFNLLARLLMMIPAWLLYLLVMFGVVTWVPRSVFSILGKRLMQYRNEPVVNHSSQND